MFATLHYVMRLRVIDYLKFSSEYNRQNGEIIFTKISLSFKNDEHDASGMGVSASSKDLRLTDREAKELPLGVFVERIGLNMNKWDAICNEITHKDSLYAINLFYEKACRAEAANRS